MKEITRTLDVLWAQVREHNARQTSLANCIIPDSSIDPDKVLLESGQNPAKSGQNLADLLNEDQTEEIKEAMTRVRMGKTGYYHEIASLILERDNG
jgi:hypothetical protein